MRYPQEPGWKTNEVETSRSAALGVRNKAALLRARCLELIRESPATSDEIAQKLNLPIVSVRPRISELHALGQIEPSSERRRTIYGKTAVVWKIKEEDKRQLRLFDEQ